MGGSPHRRARALGRNLAAAMAGSLIATALAAGPARADGADPSGAPSQASQPSGRPTSPPPASPAPSPSQSPDKSAPRSVPPVFGPTAPKPPTAEATADDKALITSMAVAVAQAKATGKPAQVVAATTEYSTMTANPDGSFTHTQDSVPQRVKQNGNWVPVDTTLVFASDGTVRPKAALLGITLSGGAAGPMAVEDDHAGHVLSASWPTKLPKPTLSGPSATYPNIYPGVDLVVTAAADSVSDVLVVHDATAAANPALSTLHLGLSAPGLTVSTTGDGAVQAVDTAGKPVFGGPTPKMWDSTGAARATATSTSGNPAAPDAVTTAAPTTWTMPAKVHGDGVDMHPDQKVLHGAKTVFPLFLDPTIGNPSQTHTELWECDANTSYYMHPDQGTFYNADVVRVGNNNCGRVYSLLTFDTTYLFNARALVLQQAHVNLLRQYGSCASTDLVAISPFDNTTTWGHQANSLNQSIWAGSSVQDTGWCGSSPPPTFSLNDMGQLQNVYNTQTGGFNHGPTVTVALEPHYQDTVAHEGWQAFCVTHYYNHGTCASTGTDAQLVVQFLAEPWTADLSINPAPVGVRGASTAVCGTQASPGYLPIGNGSLTVNGKIGDFDDGRSVSWLIGINDETSTGHGTIVLLSSTNTSTVAYAAGQWPLPGSGNTTPVTATLDQTNPSNALADGHLYSMFMQVEDNDSAVQQAWNNVSGGWNWDPLQWKICYFRAAATAPTQPKPISGGSFLPSGTPASAYPNKTYPVSGANDGTLMMSTSAVVTPIDHFDYAVNNSSTNIGLRTDGSSSCVPADACGRIPVSQSTGTMNIAIPVKKDTQVGGTNYAYITAVDAAGNVSWFGEYDFFLAAAYQKTVFGDVTGDGIPDIVALVKDTAGTPHLKTLPANTDPALAAANWVEAASDSAAPIGTFTTTPTWDGALIAHLGAERVQPVDDMFAWQKDPNGTGHMYYYLNAAKAGQTLSADAFSQTQQGLVTRPACVGVCPPGYDPSTWNNVKQMVALGPVAGGCDPATPTIACKTNLITAEDNGAGGPTRLFLFTPAGTGQLRNPQLIGTSDGSIDWATAHLVSPGPAGARALPDLWALDTDGTLWRYANRAGDPHGLGDSGTRTRIGAPGQFLAFQTVAPAGDVNGDGVPDAYGVSTNGQVQQFWGSGSGAGYSLAPAGTYGSSRVAPLTAPAFTTTAAGDSTLSSFNGAPITAGASGPLVLAVANGSQQLCLDDYLSGTANGTTNVDVYACNGTGPQSWTLNPSGTISPVQAPGKCLDTGATPGTAKFASNMAGGRITLWDCTSSRSANQTWQLLNNPTGAAPNGQSLYNPAAGLCVDDPFYSTTNTTQFQLWYCGSGDTAQIFTLPAGSGRTQRIEAESLWGTQSGATPTAQGNCCGVSFSNGYQSFFPANAVNSSVTYNWYVPQAGTYTVAPSLTKASDYGQYTLTIDTGPTLPTTFDGYQTSVVPPAPFVFGKATLTAGLHSFTFTATGTNSASTGNRYILGVDTIALRPTSSTGPTVALTTSPSALVGVPVTADATGTTAGTSAVSSYTFDFGDGTVVGPQASATATHTYGAIGTYTTSVKVNDGSPTSATSVNTIPVTAGPSSMWKLNEGSGTAAADTGTSAAFPATTSGGVSLTPGGYGLFDGTSGYVATGAPAIDTTKSFTVAAWVKLTTTNGYQTILTQQGNQVGGFHLEFENNGTNGNIWAFARATGDVANANFVRANASAGSAQNGLWTHLIASWDASTGLMSLYQNGQLVASAVDNSPIASAGPLVIGRGFYNGAGNNYTGGGIADVRVYQQPFGADLASWLYQNTGFAKNNSLVYTLGTPNTLVSNDGSDRACSTDPAHPALSVSNTPTLKANVSGTGVHADFEIQDVTNPNATPPLTYASSGTAGTVASTSVLTTTPQLANGHTFLWNVRADNGQGSISKNHAPCYLQVLPAGQTAAAATGAAGALFDNTVYLASSGPVSWSGPLTTLTWQADGNLVLYKKNGQPIWSSGTAGYGGAVLALQNDGNLVVYKTMPMNTIDGTLYGAVLWNSGTGGKGGFDFVTQTDGNMVIYGPSGALFGTHGNVWNLANVAVGRCLDSNAQGQLYSNPCDTTNGFQRWTISDNGNGTLTFQDNATGLCVDGDGTNVYTHSCNAGNGFQQWYPTWGGSGWILKHAATGKVLDMQSGGTPYFNTQNGGNYQQWD